MRSRLDAEIDFDGDELLELLNKSPVELAVPSKPLRPKRTQGAAAELQKHLRAGVDRWIASGCQQDGSEVPRQRSISRIEREVYGADAPQMDEILRDWYWLSKGIRAKVEFRSGKSHAKLTLDAVDHANPHAATSEAGTLIVKLLMTDLRFRIAKCRQPHCNKYFLLPDKRKQSYANGTYCSTSHNRAMSAAKRTKERREGCHEKQIKWAAAKLGPELRKRPNGSPAWYEDLRLKQRLVYAVNRRLATYRNRVKAHIRINWVTRNRKAIQAAVQDN